MASVGNIQLFANETLSASSISETKTTELRQLNFIGMLKLANTAGATVSGTIEHSPDGVDWITLVILPAVSADGFISVEVTNFVFPRVRANLDVVGGSADVSCFLWYDRRG